MNEYRCPKCKKLLMAMTDRTGRTEFRCLKCDKVDPMKTDAVKWANSGLSGPTQTAGNRDLRSAILAQPKTKGHAGRYTVRPFARLSPRPPRIPPRSYSVRVIRFVQSD
jgi:phage FluMu protein Com